MLVLARAAAAEARLLALDDPVNALDDAVARRVLEGLATLPSAVVITLASESAVSGLDYRIIHLGRVHRSGEEAPPRSDRSSRSVSTPMSFR
jgi:ABC-type cobalamin/Fe3+-siderophores transport system ATPase subunit